MGDASWGRQEMDNRFINTVVINYSRCPAEINSPETEPQRDLEG